MTKLSQCYQCQHMIKADHNFCPDCGHPKQLRRINKDYITSEISNVFYLNRGFLFTIKELLIRPGTAVQSFLREDRRRLVKPVTFLIISSLIYTLIQQIFEFNDGYINLGFGDWEDKVIGKMAHWISSNYGYTNILMTLFISLWIKILFRKHPYNYYEIYILLCYVTGITMLTYAVFGIAESVTGLAVLQFGVNIGLIYSSWAIGQFFNQSKIIAYFKAFFCYMLGITTFIIAVVAIGMLLEWILH